ncbi:MAG: glycoside hydrolase family 2 TIM barrel-domain containing protein [Xanthomonadales bacterium]|nr:glycoside hydrolase family 2 TIM barrel-domain containing protein [Xanthomonadales bacterium]
MITRRSNLFSAALATLLAAAATWLPTVQAIADGGAIPVEIVERDGRYHLLRGGEIYEVKGAGLEFGNMEALAAHGGNSFRTWRTDNGQQSGFEVLDRAEALGLTVALCIEIGRERHGFDYDDEAAVAAQLAYARGEVEKYKDHPALLVWIIGNEPNLFFENPKVFDAIDEIAEMIHEVDGRHPATTALAGFKTELAQLIRTRAPALDFVSIQMYGDIVNLPRYLAEAGWDRPYMVTEWGATGHWEVAKTSWDSPVEQHSSAKADSYLRAYRSAIAVDPARVLGSYVFLWGQKQERTPTWYGMFLADGAETEVIDVMHYLWNGAWPADRAPRVQAMRLDGRVAGEEIVLPPGATADVAFDVEDPEGGALRYRWEVMRESEATQTGGDREAIPETLDGLVTPGDAGRIRLAAPAEPGAYRLFAYAYDGQGKAAHANVPFLVRRK